MKSRILILLALFALLGLRSAVALKDAGRRPYVQSGPDGVFYARCIPDDAADPGGFTDIYRVEKERDTVVDHYPWFSARGVVLGWSPKAGKVGVLALGQDSPAPAEKHVELSLYLGGAFLKSWTTADLQRLGAVVSRDVRSGERAEFQVLGCNQIPGTNDYVFTLQFAKNQTVAFDILTGEPFHK